MSEFIGYLDVRLIEDTPEGLWLHLAPFSFYSSAQDTQVTAHVGDTTDFMTVPRVPLVYCKLGNRGRKLGAIHDAAYKYAKKNGMTRSQCDDLILELGPMCGFSKEETWEIYVAVRMCGQPHFDGEK